MSEKYSIFTRITNFRALFAIGAVLSCGWSQMHAGNAQPIPTDPIPRIYSLQYNIAENVWSLRADFTDNRKFVKLLVKAHKAMKAYEEMSSLPGLTDWRVVAEAYHAAFEELKKQLQGEWRRIFGNGPSRFPWNGHSDGCTDLWREDGLRRDMPVVLSFWDNVPWGHICPTTIWNGLSGGSMINGTFQVPNDNRAYVPNNVPDYSKQRVINKKKEIYQKYVLKFFKASDLMTCYVFLQGFFCGPVEKIIKKVAPTLEQAVCKKDLQLLLNLYADYYSLDAIEQHRQHECFVETTQPMVRLMVQCYANYKQWNPEDQQWLCSLLDNLEANYYVKENLHTYCIQSHHLWTGFYCYYTVLDDVRSGPNGTVYTYRTIRIIDEGLRDVFKNRGNPLPEATWLKFVNYAGRRFSLILERLSWGESWSFFGSDMAYGPTKARTILHRSQTFDQVPWNEAKESPEELFRRFLGENCELKEKGTGTKK